MLRSFLLLAVVGLTAALPAAQTAAAVSDDIVNANPNYAYSFEVADDEQQVYHGHSQTMEDKVVTGEYSWVDSLGTRHVTVYRADETGFNIIEQREEVGAVVMRARPAAAAIQPVVVRQPVQPIQPVAQQQPIRQQQQQGVRRKLVRVVKRPRVAAPLPEESVVVAVEEPVAAAPHPLPVQPQPLPVVHAAPLPIAPAPQPFIQQHPFAFAPQQQFVRFPQQQQQQFFHPQQQFFTQPQQFFAHPQQQVVRVAVPVPVQAAPVPVQAAPAANAGVTVVRFSGPGVNYEY